MQRGNQTSYGARKRPLDNLIETNQQMSSINTEQSVQPVKKSRLGGGFTDEQIRKLLDKKSTHENEADRVIFLCF